MKIHDILLFENDDTRSTKNPISLERAREIFHASAYYKQFGDQQFLYRGLDASNGPHVEHITGKRTPRDMSPFIANYLNEKLREKFGIEHSPREIGLFTYAGSRGKILAATYGSEHRCIPLENYKFYTIPNVKDLYLTGRSAVAQSVKDALRKIKPDTAYNTIPIFNSAKTINEYAFMIFRKIARNIEDTPENVSLVREHIEKALDAFVEQYQDVSNPFEVEGNAEIIVVSKTVLMIPESEPL